MSGNITEEQFKKFCKDFVEKYEGRNFQELVKSLGKDWKTEYKGNATSSLAFVDRRYGLGFGNNEDGICTFGYSKNLKLIFVNCYENLEGNYFYTVEDLYKFFKMYYKETTNFSKVNSKVTFNIPIETIKEDYIEFLSKKHNLNKESIELEIVM